MQNTAARSLYTSSSLYTKLACGMAVAVLSFSATQAAHAASGAQVVSGNTSVTRDGNTVNVNQKTDKTIINWRDFDIGAGEATRFTQPSANAVALNRVTNGQATQIDGSLSANGKLFVVNPQGIVFGQGAQVNVGGLIASTADISDKNFNAGSYLFNQAGSANASIVNKGSITAQDSGLVALVAPQVQNDGIITARLGTVALGGADKFSVDLNGDGLLSFSVEAPGAKSVTHNGSIAAQGGTVQITTNAAKGLVDNAINLNGALDASSIGAKTGKVLVNAGEGAVSLAGAVDVSGAGAGQKAGSAEIYGKSIALAPTASVNASGNAGGGSVKIGGDFQGSGDAPKAETLTVAKGATVTVSATQNGNGGTAILWSDKDTKFAGSITGNGGAEGGNGGFAEVSGKKNLTFTGDADLSSAKGAAGMLYLDPDDLTVNGNPANDPVANTYSAALLSQQLNGGTDVLLAAVQNLFVQSAISSGGAGNLTLNANGANLYVNAGIATGAGSLNLNTNGGSININGVALSTTSGNINLSSVSGPIQNFGGSINTTSGNININPAGGFFYSTANAINNTSGTTLIKQNASGSLGGAVAALGTAANSPYGATIMVNPGTYNESFNIDKSHVTLVGFSGQSIITGGITTSAGLTGTNIDNLVFNGGAVGVKINGGSFTVQNSIFQGNVTGIEADGTSGSQVLNNQFYGTGTDIGVNNSTGIWVYKNISTGSTGTGVDMRGSTGRIESNQYNTANTAISVADSNVRIDSNLIETANTGIAAARSGVTIVKNNMKNISQDGIFVDAITGEILSNTVDTAGKHGVYVYNSKGILVDSNTVKNAFDGITFHLSDNSTARNNNITGTQANMEHGIGAYSSPGVQFLGNAITGGLIGIYADGSNGMLADSNPINDAGIGIWAHNSKGGLARTNNVYNSTNVGLMASGQPFRFKGNSVIGGGDGIVMRDIGANCNTLGSCGSEIDTNTITSVRGNGIYIQDGGPEIQDFNNIISNVGGTGLFVFNTPYTFSTGDRITNSGENGIIFNKSPNSQIYTASVLGANRTGVALVESANSNVVGNVIRDVVGNSLEIVLSDNVKVLSNNITTTGATSAGRGATVIASNGVVLDSNSVVRQTFGYALDNSDNVKFFSNTADHIVFNALDLTNSTDNATGYGNIAVSTGGVIGTDSTSTNNTVTF